MKKQVNMESDTVTDSKGPSKANTPGSSVRASSVKRVASSMRRQSSVAPHHFDAPLPDPSSIDLGDLNIAAVPWWCSQRLRLAVLCFFGFMVLYAQRVNLSIAMVCMASAGGHGSDHANSSAITKKEEETEFDWDRPLQSLLLGAFFWGYMVLQVPGGRIAEVMGAKRVIAIGMFPVAVLTLLTPVVARADPYAFLVLRVFVGLGEGVMYPAAQALWTNWAPPLERSKLIGFSYAGGQFGNAIIFPIGGFLCAEGFDGGWASIFYVMGGIGFIWCCLWVYIAHDGPEQSPWIGDLELKYITRCLATRPKKKAGSGTPWKAIWTSAPVWAIIVAHFCGNYGTYLMLTKVPTYMKEVLKFDIKANGVYSMLPYLAFWFCITLSAIIADALVKKEILTLGKTRKLMSVIGTVGPACAIVGLSFMTEDEQVEAVVLLIFSVGLCGFHFSGFFINHGDIAPMFAGTLFGITNTFATVSGIVAPAVAGAMTPNGTREEWQETFYVAAGIYIFGALFYVLLGTSEVQPWAQFEEDAPPEFQEDNSNPSDAARTEDVPLSVEEPNMAYAQDEPDSEIYAESVV